MTISIRSFLAVSGLLLGLQGSALADEITAVTEESILAYLEDGKPAGPAVEIVKATLTKAGLKYKVEIFPWARSYKMAQEIKNVIIFPIARTAEREEQFQWVDTLLPIEYVLYKHKSKTDLKVSSLADLKNLRIGVVRDDVRHNYLKKQGLEDGKQLEPVPSNKMNLAKVVAGRIDVFPSTRLGLLQLCKEEPVQCKELSPAYTLDELTGAVFLALSKGTSPDTAKKIRDAYAALKADGTYEKILAPVLNAGK